MDIEYMQQASEEGQVRQQDFYEDQEQQQASAELFQGNDMSKLVRTFLEEDKIPQEVKNHKLFKHFWAILGKTPKITFLTNEDVLEFHSRFRQAKYLYIMSVPPYEFTFEELHLLKELEIYFILTLKRSVGVPKHIMNERGLLSTTIHQRISTSDANMSMGQGGGGGGVINRIKRMF